MGTDDGDTVRRLAGLATPMAIRVAVTLGLPDRLRADRATAEELATELGVAPVPLGLLLNHLAALGLVDRAETGFRTTGFGTSLCADADGGWTNLMLRLDSAAGRSELAFVELAHSSTTGEAGYVRRYGTDFWSDAADHPVLRESFDRQMTMRFRDQIPQVLAALDWSRFGTLVDVGGGHGTMLAAILHANPDLRGQLVDLEPTAAGARKTFRDEGLDDRTEVFGTSFFDPLPAGADAYVLVDIIHDWDDEHAHKIMARCVEAARPDSSILVIEAVGGQRASSESDLAMLVMYGGRERRIDEFRALGAAHGLVLDRTAGLTDQRYLLEFRFDAR